MASYRASRESGRPLEAPAPLGTEHELPKRPVVGTVPEAILDWLTDATTHTDRPEHAARAAIITRAERERSRLNERLNVLFQDRLDGTITKASYEHQATTLRAQQNALDKKINDLYQNTLLPLHTAVQIARMTSNAARNFQRQKGTYQRQLLNTVLKHATWRNSTLHATLLEQFDRLR